MTHKEAERPGYEVARCTAGHADGQAVCFVCAGCGEHIRPMEYETEQCAGMKTAEDRFLSTGIVLATRADLDLPPDMLTPTGRIDRVP